MQTVYIDSLFLINAAVNYALILCTAKVCGLPAKRLRIAAACVLGAAYAVGAVFLPFLRSPPLKIACGVAMVLAVFGGERRIARIGLIFFAVSAAFGGAVYAVSMLRGGGGAVRMSARTLLASFAICYALFSIVFRRLGRAHVSALTADVSLSLGERSVRMTALRDTGHSLSDPATGQPVIIISRRAAASLLPPEQAAALSGGSDPAACVLAAGSAGLRLRLVPYSAVGVSGGLLPAFRADEAVIDGKILRGPLAAVSPTEISDGGGYSALIGGSL